MHIYLKLDRGKHIETVTSYIYMEYAKTFGYNRELLKLIFNIPMNE